MVVTPAARRAAVLVPARRICGPVGSVGVRDPVRRRRAQPSGRADRAGPAGGRLRRLRVPGVRASTTACARSAGTLTEALGTVLGHPVELTVAGRTDKRGPRPRPGRHVRRPGRRARPAGAAPVAQQDVRPADRGPRAADGRRRAFDARFSATARRYRYLVLNRPTPDPFLPATRGTSTSRCRCRAWCWRATRSSASTTSPRSAVDPSRATGATRSLVRRVT